IKFHVKPGVLHGGADGTCDQVKDGPGSGDQYLRDSLRKYLASGDICADFFIQFQEDPVAQPIEDTSVEWKPQEFKVARLVVKQMTLVDGNADEAACEQAAFTPWNALVEHRPLGNIMRARRAVYAGSAQYRGAVGTQ